MMAKTNFPVTSATRFLQEKNIVYTPYQYTYEEQGGTKQTAQELNTDEHAVIKTLVLASEKEVYIVLMHGDMEISIKEFSRILNIKKIEMCRAEVAIKSTGYQFGGTSPFGTKKQLPIYAEESIFDIDEIYINGGKQGFILKINSKDLLKAFDVKKVKTGIRK